MGRAELDEAMARWAAVVDECAACGEPLDGEDRCDSCGHHRRR